MSDKARTPVILKGGARTPTGRFLGGLSPVSAPDLGATVIKAVVERTGIDTGDVEEVIMGNVVSAGAGQAPARQAAVNSGRHHPRPHGEQGLRLGAQGRHARGAGDPGR